MLIIAAIDPSMAGFDALCAESQREGQRMLVRLRDNWQSGANRFALTGEMLNGAFLLQQGSDERQLVGICGRNIDPFADSPRIGRVRHLFVTRELRRQGVGQLLMTHLLADAPNYFDLLNTHAPQSADAFYRSLGFVPVADDAHVTHRFML